MKFVKLDRTGHTALDVEVDAMIAKLEQEFATGGVAVVANQPGQESMYIRKASDVTHMDPETEIVVMPQLMGG